MSNSRSGSNLTKRLSPIQLAELYGFERYHIVLSCLLPAKAPKPFLNNISRKLRSL